MELNRYCSKQTFQRLRYISKYILNHIHRKMMNILISVNKMTDLSDFILSIRYRHFAFPPYKKIKSFVHLLDLQISNYLERTWNIEKVIHPVLNSFNLVVDLITEMHTRHVFKIGSRLSYHQKFCSFSFSRLQV